jgi:hypothetical protein
MNDDGRDIQSRVISYDFERLSLNWMKPNFN